jgi:hypothetical protein
LSEPKTEARWGRTSWFNDGAVTARPASSLGEAESSALHEKLRAMRVEINKLADSIASPPGRGIGDKELAQALRRIAVVPSDEHFVWSVEGRPLLVNWGQVYINDSRPEEAIVGEGLLPRKAWTLPVPEPPPPVIPKPPNRWYLSLLAWLLFIGLTGAIYFLLLRACGIFIAPEASPLARFLPNACHVAARPIDSSILAERGDLERRIRDAQLNLARQVNDCPPPPPPPPPRRPPVNEAQIQDMQKRVRREHGETGKLQVSLKWDGLEDLDLHVKCPGGELSFTSPDGPNSSHQFCGGTLDVDMNNGRDSTTPVENSFWPNPPNGDYEVYVSFYGRKGQPPRSIPFTVLVQREGEPPRTFNGTMSREGQSSSVYKFSIP